MDKLLVGNKSDLTNKKVVEYSVAKVCGCRVLDGAAADVDPSGIRRSIEHPLPRDLGEERHKR